MSYQNGLVHFSSPHRAVTELWHIWSWWHQTRVWESRSSCAPPGSWGCPIWLPVGISCHLTTLCSPSKSVDDLVRGRDFGNLTGSNPVAWNMPTLLRSEVMISTSSLSRRLKRACWTCSLVCSSCSTRSLCPSVGLKAVSSFCKIPSSGCREPPAARKASCETPLQTAVPARPR